MRYSDGKPEDLERARAAVRQWRAGQLVADLGAGFHPDWAPVLRAMLFVVDRHAARVVTGIAGESR
ncbi:MAG: hypothetical protein ACRDOD_00260 [Streptosporangiaceae bacterium]